MIDFNLVLCAAWFFMLGCAVGSFYNVLIDRLPNGQDIIKDRSKCTFCGTVLKWQDLIPVFSYIFLKGKCRYCGKKLSPQYLFSELSVGAIFLLAFLFFYNGHFSWAGLIMNLSLWSMLFVVAVMDFKSGIIVDQVLLFFSLVGIVAQLLGGRSGLQTVVEGEVIQTLAWSPLQMLYGALTGLGLYGLVYLAARLFYKKEGFGMGDVLLLGAIGIFLGPVKTLITGVMAFYVSIMFLLFFKLVKKVSLKDRAIPFAPPMCIAAFIMSLFGNEIAAWLGNYLGFR